MYNISVSRILCNSGWAAAILLYCDLKDILTPVFPTSYFISSHSISNLTYFFVYSITALLIVGSPSVHSLRLAKCKLHHV